MTPSNKKIKDILNWCGDLLYGNPESWTQGYLARNKNKKPYNLFDPFAVSFCALGMNYVFSRNLGSLMLKSEAIRVSHSSLMMVNQLLKSKGILKSVSYLNDSKGMTARKMAMYFYEAASKIK